MMKWLEEILMEKQNSRTKSLILWCNEPSTSGRALAKALGIKKLKNPVKNTLINWGNSETLPPNSRCEVINHPKYVRTVVNKSRFLCSEEGDSLVPREIKLEATKNPEQAKLWLDQGHNVVTRTLVASSQGKGIEITNPGEDLKLGKLYTKLFPKSKEFRAHVLIDSKNRPRILWQRKYRKENGNARLAEDDIIVNHKNGFVFGIIKDENNIPLGVRNMVKDILIPSLTGKLSFSAVDILWSNKLQKAVVCEINSRPGIEKTTLEFYVNFFKEFYND